MSRAKHFGRLAAAGLAPAAALAAERVSVERSVVSWGLLAALLAVACGFVVLRWLHDRGLTRERARLRSLFEFSESVLAASDRGELLKRAAATAASAAGATHAAVLLADRAGRGLAYAAGDGPLPRGVLPVSAISGAVACFRSREVTDVPDAATCPFLDKDLVRKRGQKAVLYAPIVSGETCLGVIEVEDRKRRRPFDAGQRAGAAHVAKLTAIGLRAIEQRLLVERLHRAEKLAAVSELASAIAGEMREPFDEIRALCESLPYPATPRDLELRLEGVARLIDRADSAVDKLVRFASPSVEASEEIDLNALLRQLVADLRKRPEGREIQVKLGLSKRPPLVLADPTHVQQVFQFLLRHALHFLDRVGAKALQIHTMRRDRMVAVAFGPLAGPDQPLRWTLAGDDDKRSIGSNLGLSVCQSLIERAGGQLQIDLNSSLGFRIEVEYPLASDPWQAGPESGDGEQTVGPRAASMTALVVDADPAVRRSLVRALADMSYRAVPAASGEEALAFCERVRFEWVFCDLRLPPAGATELWRRLHERVDRFVFLTDDASAADSFAVDGAAVLVKPFAQEDVERVVESLLRGAAVLADG